MLKGMVHRSGHDSISTLLTPINDSLVATTYQVVILSIVSFNTTESTGAEIDAFSPPLFLKIFFLISSPIWKAILVEPKEKKRGFIRKQHTKI